MNNGYTWYGHPFSYFSMKLDAALKFYALSYEKKEISLGTELEPIRKRAGTHMIPVLETPEGWALWDTTPIMFLLDSRHPDRPMFGPGLSGLMVHVIENFLDEWLGRTMVHYRWHYQDSTEFAAPRLASGDAEKAKGIATWGLRACRATGVGSEHQQEMAEVEYKRLLRAADTQLQETRYLMGDAPCAVDAVMLGGLRAHTMNDPAPSRLVRQFPHVVKWAEGGADLWDGSGNLAPASTPTGFATAMLAEMRNGFIPFILGNRKALANRDKSFIARVYNEDVSYLTRPYPEAACQMVNKHIQRLQRGDEAPLTAISAWGLQALYAG